VHGEKRLLLSDPDVVNNRLLQMEKEIQRLTAELESNKHDTTNKMASFTTELESNKRQTTHQMTDLASKIAKLEQSSSGKFLCGIFIRY
jgi:septal ring factor EnvC (AmiA/AmiB activator)